MSIKIWNRAARRMEEEKVYGGSLVNSLYGTTTGRLVSDWFLSRKWFSDVVGDYHSSRWSKAKITDFIRDFEIPMQDFEAESFKSFNDFFIRRFKSGLRPFPVDAKSFGSPAEGRLYAFKSWDSQTKLPVKGLELGPLAILERPEVAKIFQGGPIFLIRLCPVDYHWFHYPDAGTTENCYRLEGKYHSVNPAAVAAFPTVFAQNERHVSILQTEHFGRLAYVEVGAMCVGKIVQTHAVDQPFRRGDAKGHFLFGGSTVIVFGEAGKLTPDSDLLEKTQNGVESLVRLGEPIAQNPL